MDWYPLPGPQQAYLPSPCFKVYMEIDSRMKQAAKDEKKHLTYEGAHRRWNNHENTYRPYTNVLLGGLLLNRIDYLAISSTTSCPLHPKNMELQYEEPIVSKTSPCSPKTGDHCRSRLYQGPYAKSFTVVSNVDIVSPLLLLGTLVVDSSESHQF